MSTATAKRPTTTSQRLYEESYGIPIVDRENGIIKNVKVLGTVSKNGREYSESAKKDAVRILEGCTVNLDHDRANPNSERKFLDGIGTLHGLRNESDGVYASEFRVKKSHPAADVVFESAERFPKNFGLSINAEGKVGRRNGRVIVESLSSAQSVDIVGKPATTDGIFESVDKTGKGVEVIKRTVKQLIESHGTADQKTRLTKLLEASGGDAAMIGQPVDVPPMSTDPEVDGDDTSSMGCDPMDQISDAFVALVASVMDNAALDLKAKLAQITVILTTQDQLINGTATAAKTAPVKEDDQSDEGDNDMQESLKPIQAAVTAILESQKKTDARMLLIESAIEVTPDKITALVAAADDAARKTLLESWPPKQRPMQQRPQMQALKESQATLPTFPVDAKTFASAIKG